MWNLKITMAVMCLGFAFGLLALNASVKADPIQCAKDFAECKALCDNKKATANELLGACAKDYNDCLAPCIKTRATCK